MTTRIWTATVLSAVVVLGGCSGARPIETIRASADHRFSINDYQGATEEYAEIVSRYPGDWQAQYRLGLCQLRTGDLSAARRALEIAWTGRPQNHDVASALAEVLFQQDDHDRLYAFLRDRASTTQSVKSHLLLARYSIELGDADSAQTAINTAIQIDAGRTTEPYLMAARLAEHLGKLDESVRRLRQALGINPDDPRVLERLKAMGETLAAVDPLPPGR